MAGQNEAIGRANEMNTARGQQLGLMGQVAGQDLAWSQGQANLDANREQNNAQLRQNAAWANQKTQVGIGQSEFDSRQRQENLSYSNLKPGTEGFASPQNVATGLTAALMPLSDKRSKSRIGKLDGSTGKAMSPGDGKKDIQLAGSSPGAHMYQPGGTIGAGTRVTPNWYVGSAAAYGQVLGSALANIMLAKSLDKTCRDLRREREEQRPARATVEPMHRVHVGTERVADTNRHDVPVRRELGAMAEEPRGLVDHDERVVTVEKGRRGRIHALPSQGRGVGASPCACLRALPLEKPRPGPARPCILGLVAPGSRCHASARRTSPRARELRGIRRRTRASFSRVDRELLRWAARPSQPKTPSCGPRARDFGGFHESTDRTCPLCRRARHNYRNIIHGVGEDHERQGLLKTPERASKAIQFLTQGYHMDPKVILNSAIFDEEYSEMVLVKDIEVYSLCEHHMLPFFGKAHIAYIPNGKIVGLSKLRRIVDVFARRLQVQERLTHEILNCIQDGINPLGTAVVIEARHLCMMMRGVQ